MIVRFLILELARILWFWILGYFDFLIEGGSSAAVDVAGERLWSRGEKLFHFPIFASFNFPGLLGTSGSVVPVAFHNFALLSIRDARAAFFVIVLCLHWPLVVFVFVHVGLPCNHRWGWNAWRSDKWVCRRTCRWVWLNICLSAGQ